MYKYKNSKTLFYELFTQACIGLTLFITAAIASSATTQEEFEARQAAHLQATKDSGDMIVSAALDISNQTALDQLIENYQTSDKADFTLIKLVRILFLNDTYDSQITTAIRNAAIPSRLQNGEERDIYWSENHMIMWMSSEWLLDQHNNKTPDAGLRERIVHFLDLKATYGFYEFLSSNYFPYTMSALLNLADYSDDTEIKSKATAAVKRLLTEVLWATTQDGIFFPVAGRSNTGKYITKYDEITGDRNLQNHDKVIYVLTGLGADSVPTSASSGSVFLATTAVDMTDVIESHNAVENLVITNSGHGAGANIHPAGFSDYDITQLQWSAGGYYHSSTWDDTIDLIDDYNLEDHQSFKDWHSLLTTVGKTSSQAFAKGGNIANLDVDIYKNKSVMLASINQHYGGYMGWQTWPWAATVENFAVWTQSGQVKSDWSSRSNVNNNTHLPRVIQQDNLAMAIYKPDLALRLGQVVGELDLDVALYWPDNEFDEVVEDGRWIIGRKGDSYIAAFRACTGTINGIRACDGGNRDGRQLWGMYVGNADTHQSFNNFVSIIGDAGYKDSYGFQNVCKNFLTQCYWTRLTVDGNKIEHVWNN
jgi:hypothetical protein